MKKVLFSTTALAAAGMLAFSASDAQAGSHSKPKPLSLSLGGFMKAMVGFTSNDSAFQSESNSTARVSFDSFNQVNDSEIYFRGSTKLDNGITASVTVQLEADQAVANTSAFTIDESYLKLTGGFGDLRLGTTKKASFLLQNTAPWTGSLNPQGPDTNNWVRRPTATAISGVIGTGVGAGDDMTVVYVSPSISGLRLGASYVTSTDDDDDLAETGGNNGDTAGQDIDAAIQYKTKAGSIGISADLSWSQRRGPEGRPSPTSAGSFDAWRFGGKLTFGGIEVGGSFRDQSDVDAGLGGTANSVEVESYDMGISYAAGPFKIAATYFHAEAPLASGTPGDDSVDKFMLGANYKIGEGVTALGTLAYVDWSDEATAAGSNNDGWAVVGGIRVAF